MTAAGSVCRSPAHAIVFCAWTAAISSTCGIPGSQIFKSATIIICWPTHPIGWKNAHCCFGNTKHWWWTRHTSFQMPRGRCTQKLCPRRTWMNCAFYYNRHISRACPSGCGRYFSRSLFPAYRALPCRKEKLAYRSALRHSAKRR